jgi:hypothetical protein
MMQPDLPIFVVLAGLVYLMASAGLVPYVAQQNGRSGFGWMFIALILTPLLALIALAAMPEAEPPPPLNPFDTER